MSTELSNFVQLLLEAALPILAGALLVFLKQWLKIQADRLEEHLGQNRWYAVKDAVREAVAAAEQSGVREGLEKAGEKKLEQALITAEAFLDARGLGGIDLHVLAELIEAEVLNKFNHEATILPR